MVFCTQKLCGHLLTGKSVITCLITCLKDKTVAAEDMHFSNTTQLVLYTWILLIHSKKILWQKNTSQALC